MSSLPPELTADILSRLPVKSLLRFRCVSKWFCSLIDSLDFINLHLNRSVESDTNHALTLAAMGVGSTVCMVDVDSLDNPVRLDNPFRIDSDRTVVIGHCNGLIALRSRSNLILWNPSIRKYRLFPNSWKIIAVEYDVYGFGYDAVNDDYKIIRILELCSETMTSEISIYSLKSNMWRKVEYNFRYSLSGYQQLGALVDGSLHWIVSTPESEYVNIIIAYNLNSHEFFEVAIPDMPHKGLSRYLDVLGGCLGMSYWNMPESTFDVWRMKGSWTKLFSFPQYGEIGWNYYVNVLACSKSGDKALMDVDWNLHWYDLQTQTLDRGRVPGDPDCVVAMIVCVSSLVSPNAATGHLEEDAEEN